VIHNGIPRRRRGLAVRLIALPSDSAARGPRSLGTCVLPWLPARISPHAAPRIDNDMVFKSGRRAPASAYLQYRRINLPAPRSCRESVLSIFWICRVVEGVPEMPSAQPAKLTSRSRAGAIAGNDRQSRSPAYACAAIPGRPEAVQIEASRTNYALRYFRKRSSPCSSAPR